MSILDYYEFLEHIGIGSTSSIFKAREKITGQNVAIKVISKTVPLSVAYKSKQLLPHILPMDHNYVIHYFEWFEDDQNLYVVMEYIPKGSLLDFINDNVKLSENQIQIFALQIVEILNYLHNEMNLIHRDLKAENFLIDQYNNLRLVDFGFAKRFEKDDSLKQTICGSPIYAAPEMILQQEYSSSVDIWSTGVILYAMESGKLPFKVKDMANIADIQINFDILDCSPELKDLIKKMMTKNPQERISLNEIQKHPFMIHRRLPIIKVFRSENITKITLMRMKAMKIDISNIEHDLKNNIINHKTAIYKILNTDWALSQLMNTPNIPKIVANYSKNPKCSTPPRFASLAPCIISRSSPTVMKLLTVSLTKASSNKVTQAKPPGLPIIMPNVRRRVLVDHPIKCVTPILPLILNE
ncbi:CAMK family protein kinase [Tritrichomonas foetus]|uniref:CAMK family protein kinase n=1 Tax=Tritrichomonas foetus TaxID=1144522 RepID=A0A1J4KWT0_9EUKA|nr:CAMK family protein kinase [Tritrichomonas foetus]|eukprot:OHT15707.1 CAMK family protein kinase [Tritrichomonas foetus]